MYRSYKIIAATLLISTGLFSNAIAHKAMHDPTEPPTYENTHGNRPNNDINITGIFAGKDSQNAMIGGHFFTIGDKISDATIIAIDATGITLKNEDGTVSKIAMPSSTVKIPTINKKETNKNVD